jgi:L-rhamnose mutarotase
MYLLRAASEAGKTSRVQRTSRSVWPEMVNALSETGWNNYSLFLRPDGLLVGYLETENFQNARAGMAKREVNARWQRDMADFLFRWTVLCPTEPWHRSKKSFMSDAALRTM